MATMPFDQIHFSEKNILGLGTLKVLMLSKLNACSLGLGIKSHYYLVTQIFALMAIQ